MLVEAVKRSNPGRVIGIDANTKSLGFCLLENGKPIEWGKLNLEGEDIYEKVKDAGIKAKIIAGLGPVDYVAIESAIMGRSPDVAIKMAMIVGACLATVLSDDTKIKAVAPMSWQAFIGNRILTKAEKQEIMDENPDRSNTWYQNKFRQFRKQRTIAWVKDTYGVDLDDDDVADSFGLAFWGSEHL